MLIWHPKEAKYIRNKGLAKKQKMSADLSRFQENIVHVAKYFRDTAFSHVPNKRPPENILQRKCFIYTKSNPLMYLLLSSLQGLREATTII